VYAWLQYAVSKLGPTLLDEVAIAGRAEARPQHGVANR
jgi:hypothetical protein